MSLGGFSMFDLYRQEAEQHGRALSDGLVSLESASDRALVEPLMRAAHSVKGAARIVGFDALVKLAHAMEDCLVRIQKGTETISAERTGSVAARGGSHRAERGGRRVGCGCVVGAAGCKDRFACEAV